MKKYKIILSITILLIFYFPIRSQWVLLNSGTSMNLDCVQFINAQTGFVVGTGSAFKKTTNGGINWISLDPFGAIELRSVYFFNSNTGLICGNGGTIIKTTNGGLNFTTENSGTTNNLFTITFYNNMFGVCSGNVGTTLYTTNAGDNWAVGNPTGYLVTFYSSFMVNSTVGYVVGINTIFSPLVAKTTNGGINWTYYSFMVNNNEATLCDAYFFDVQNGIAVSDLWNNQGGISRTTNGGLSWTSQIYTYGLFGLYFPTPTVGYCDGLNGCILKSTDGGYNWFQQTSGTSANLTDIDFIDSLIGFAVGGSGTILKTTNGGLTGFSKISTIIPNKFSLFQNYPNPFNPSTKIKFSIPELPLTKGAGLPAEASAQAGVVLKIYDILGREVATVVNEKLNPGTYEVEWDASNFASGVYFYKLSTADFTETKKMVLVK